jgi:two-component system, NtrC family, sensor histidine kinase HydH
MLKSGRISLKWRLILAFLGVSVAPVLVASYLAASAIQSAFERNLEQWITEAALFLLSEISETEKEASKAVSSVAVTLREQSPGDRTASEAARPFADLLNSVGYEFVKLYDDMGNIAFSSPGIELDVSKIQDRREWVQLGSIRGRPCLLVGATSHLEANGRRHFVVVANPVSEELLGGTGRHTSLDVRVYPLAGGNVVYDAEAAASKPTIAVPDNVLRELAAGPSSGPTLDSRDAGITTAFAGIYGTDGSLIGVIVCRLLGTTAIFEEVGRWGLFAGLAIIAGVLALFVAIIVSSRITRPLRALTSGLRAVTGGDYKARVRELGGSELEELAGGFNALAEQLDRLKAMEIEMRQSQQLAAFGEAAAVIAHEIRNPLGIIQTSAQVVRMKSSLAPAEDRMIGFVLEEVARIDTLVQDILDYVRPRDLEREPLDLREIVSHVTEVARPALAERGISDDVVPCGVALSVAGDRDRLHQAFLNLILNAMDAMPDGGRLRIVEELGDGIARISIADQGVGMSDEVRKRAFDPFFTTKMRGTGLGLAKVQAIIGDHGGSITCESRPGHGTTFTISLAILQNQGQAHAPIHSAR